MYWSLGIIVFKHVFIAVSGTVIDFSFDSHPSTIEKNLIILVKLKRVNCALILLIVNLLSCLSVHRINFNSKYNQLLMRRLIHWESQYETHMGLQRSEREKNIINLCISLASICVAVYYYIFPLQHWNKLLHNRSRKHKSH